MILSASHINKEFGGLKALDNIDLSVGENEIVSIIGPNGAGKTTFFNCLSGIYKIDSGEIFFNHKPAHRLAPHKITGLGLARTFQNIRLFSNMTVLENVMAARHCRSKSEILSAILRTPGFRREEKEILEKAKFYLEFSGLIKCANTLAKNLAYGDQRRLELARALASEPKLLLLDEPSSGMNAKEADRLMELIARIKARKIAVLIIEHHMRLVMRISERVVVFDYGRKIAEGLPSEIQKNPLVIEAYLGSDAAHRESAFGLRQN